MSLRIKIMITCTPIVLKKAPMVIEGDGGITLAHDPT